MTSDEILEVQLHGECRLDHLGQPAQSIAKGAHRRCRLGANVDRHLTADGDQIDRDRSVMRGVEDERDAEILAVERHAATRRIA